MNKLQVRKLECGHEVKNFVAYALDKEGWDKISDKITCSRCECLRKIVEIKEE